MMKLIDDEAQRCMQYTIVKAEIQKGRCLGKWCVFHAAGISIRDLGTCLLHDLAV